MVASAILNAWYSGDVALLRGALDDNVTFSSPYQDYEGSARAAHLLALVGETLKEVRRCRSWGNDEHSITKFTASVDDLPLEGVILEERTAELLTQVTLFIRPFESIKVAMKQMRGRLAENPPPVQ